MSPTFKNDPITRAIAAYYRTPGVNQHGQAELVTYEGKDYVVMVNRNGLLACYRVQNNGQLRRMVRPPKGALAGLVEEN